MKENGNTISARESNWPPSHLFFLLSFSSQHWIKSWREDKRKENVTIHQLYGWRQKEDNSRRFTHDVINVRWEKGEEWGEKDSFPIEFERGKRTKGFLCENQSFLLLFFFSLIVQLISPSPLFPLLSSPLPLRENSISVTKSSNCPLAHSGEKRNKAMGYPVVLLRVVLFLSLILPLMLVSRKMVWFTAYSTSDHFRTEHGMSFPCFCFQQQIFSISPTTTTSTTLSVYLSFPLHPLEATWESVLVSTTLFDSLHSAPTWGQMLPRISTDSWKSGIGDVNTWVILFLISSLHLTSSPHLLFFPSFPLFFSIEYLI